MESMKEENSSNRPSFFDGYDYHYWKRRMAMFLRSQNYDVGEVTFSQMKPDKDGAIPENLKAADRRAMNYLASALSNEQLDKVFSCESAYEIWNKLVQIYEGDSNVKEAKMQTYRAQFENLQMNDSEDINGFMNRVRGITNSLRGLGEVMSDANIVKKILRSLPEKFDSKVSALEEKAEYATNDLSLDMVHSVLEAYEMRKDNGRRTEKAAAFKAIEQPDRQKEEDELLANIAKTFPKGTGSYQGKLPLICWNCNGIEHISSQCNARRNTEPIHEEEEEPCRYQIKNNRPARRGRNLYIHN